MILALLQAAQATAHDRLDSAMFWVGLSFVMTPLTIGGIVLAYLRWKRRHADTKASNSLQ